MPEYKIDHISVGGVPYEIDNTPGVNSINGDMIVDGAITQKKLSPDIEFSNPLDSYPVGSLYISYEPTSPAELFGGTWLELTGVFPYFNHGTETGGSNTHTLTVDEMPSHKHGILTAWGANGGSERIDLIHHINNGTKELMNEAGGDQPHNNMPAYQSFYAWRRTA